MRSVVKCLASSILLLLTFTALAQEPEYIDYNDYYWGCGKTIKEAIDQIKFGIPMCKEVEYIIDFVSKSERGIIR